MEELLVTPNHIHYEQCGNESGSFLGFERDFYKN
jgi:hypothetical protein